MRGHFFTVDELQLYDQTRAIWEQHNLAVPRQLNTIQGLKGRDYSPYNIGQSILALPFYGLGKAAHWALDKAGARGWIETFAGPIVGEGRWGGQIEIFAVSLFNPVAVAAIVAVFFLFNRSLGVEPAWAAISAAMLGVSTHVAGFSSGFFQHPAEALFLLLTFYFLFRDAQNQNRRARLIAGILAASMLLIRPSAIVLIPALAFYAWWIRRETAAVIEFLIPVGTAIAVIMAVNYSKWGSFAYSGGYGNASAIFPTPILVGIYGYLFSPGASLFIFTPLLILAPLYFKPFARIYPKETVAIATVSLSYLFFYSKAVNWHGQWCFGPRYLMALVPILLLPLGLWLQHAGREKLVAVAVLVAVGMYIEVLHFAVNVSYVYYHERYDTLNPQYSQIFVPEISQLVTHTRGLIAMDDRVDMWLVDTARLKGGRTAELLLFSLLAALALFVRNTVFCLKTAQQKSWAEPVEKELRRTA